MDVIIDMRHIRWILVIVSIILINIDVSSSQGIFGVAYIVIVTLWVITCNNKMKSAKVLRVLAFIATMLYLISGII